MNMYCTVIYLVNIVYRSTEENSGPRPRHCTAATLNDFTGQRFEWPWFTQAIDEFVSNVPKAGA